MRRIKCAKESLKYKGGVNNENRFLLAINLVCILSKVRAKPYASVPTYGIPDASKKDAI